MTEDEPGWPLGDVVVYGGAVRCADCRHFLRVDYHARLGWCAAGVRPEPAGFWDLDWRQCERYQDGGVETLVDGATGDRR